MIRLCSASEIPEGAVKRVDLADRPPIAVYRVGGRFYATDDRCTHAGASLSEGIVDGDVIECPLHGGAFRIATGEPTDPPCTIPLETFPVRVDGDEVFLDLS